MINCLIITENRNTKRMKYTYSNLRSHVYSVPKCNGLCLVSSRHSSTDVQMLQYNDKCYDNQGRIQKLAKGGGAATPCPSPSLPLPLSLPSPLSLHPSSFPLPSSPSPLLPSPLPSPFFPPLSPFPPLPSCPPFPPLPLEVGPLKSS